MEHLRQNMEIFHFLIYDIQSVYNNYDYEYHKNYDFINIKISEISHVK